MTPELNIFVSYARVDHLVVRAIMSDLQHAAVPLTSDHDLWDVGAWWDVILDRIESSSALLAVVSDAYRSSVACRAELDWAAAVGVPVVALSLDLPSSPPTTTNLLHQVSFGRVSQLPGILRSSSSTEGRALDKPRRARPAVPTSAEFVS